MTLKRFSALALSTMLVSTIALPVSALAVDPSVEYSDGNGDPITKLTLIAADDNLAYNGGDDFTPSAKSLAKVQVPVAITFVAQPDGTLEGPNSANITNYAAFPVHVSNIKATSTSPASIVTQANCEAADEVYISFKPSSEGTAIDLGDFVSGTGDAPAAGEWNIAAASTPMVTGTAMTLTGFEGKIGGYSAIHPETKTKFGQIEWTIQPGTVESASSDSGNNDDSGGYQFRWEEGTDEGGDYLIIDGTKYYPGKDGSRWIMDTSTQRIFQTPDGEWYMLPPRA